MIIEPDFKRLKRAYERACDLIPCLREAKVNPRASVVTMMADGYPLVGPINHKQNYWLQVKLFFVSDNEFILLRRLKMFLFLMEIKLLHSIDRLF